MRKVASVSIALFLYFSVAVHCSAAIVAPDSNDKEEFQKQYEKALMMRQQVDAITNNAKKEFNRQKAISDARIMAMRDTTPHPVPPEAVTSVESTIASNKSAMLMYVGAMLAAVAVLGAVVFIITRRFTAARELENRSAHRRATAFAGTSDTIHMGGKPAIEDYFAKKMQKLKEREE